MTQKFYVISYDLKNPGRDYTSLYDAIKSLGEWQHPLESTWLIYTKEDADTITTTVRGNGNMDSNDLLFVCALQIESRQGWLPKSVWDWIRIKSK